MAKRFEGNGGRPLKFYEADELMPVTITPTGRVYIGTEPPVITEEVNDGTDRVGQAGVAATA